jgi:type VI secretion system VasD/TssJ family lipoprotein
VKRITLTLLCLQIALAGCCGLSKVLPFVHCSKVSGTVVSVNLMSSSESNAGRSLAIRVYALSQSEGFSRTPIRSFFRGDSTALEKLVGKHLLSGSVYLAPNSHDTVTVTVSSEFRYIGIVADFGNPLSEDSSRVLVDLLETQRQKNLGVRAAGRSLSREEAGH